MRCHCGVLIGLVLGVFLATFSSSVVGEQPNDFNISIDARMRDKWGFEYPVTFEAVAQHVKVSGASQELNGVRSSLFDADLARLEVEGHNAFILKPAKPEAGSEKPWVWYAPTLLADREEKWISPGERHAWIFKRLLAGGVYVAGIDVGESYGSPASRVIYDRFYAQLVNRHGFSPKPGLLPISRGGLMAYNWAANRPDCVRCIGGIYPLCNLVGYPRLERIAEPYGLSVEELRAQLDQHNPVARLGSLAAAHVPILHIHGDRDTVLPLQSHSAELARQYQALGGTAEVIVIPGKGHEVAPEYWQEPRLIEFFLKHMLPAKRK